MAVAMAQQQVSRSQALGSGTALQPTWSLNVRTKALLHSFGSNRGCACGCGGDGGSDGHLEAVPNKVIIAFTKLI